MPCFLPLNHRNPLRLTHVTFLTIKIYILFGNLLLVIYQNTFNMIKAKFGDKLKSRNMKA